MYNPNDTSTIIFGQSCPTSGISAELGREMSFGIKLAFEEVNERGGILDGKTLKLEIKDDKYEPNNTVANTQQFLNDSSIFALIGYVGTPTAKSVQQIVNDDNIPFIGAVTGARFLRLPFNRNFINIRASYNDEATAMVNYLVRKRYILKIAILYQNDSFGNNALESIRRSLDPYNIELVAEATYQRNSVADLDVSISIISSRSPDAIICAGTYDPIGIFISKYQKTVKNKEPEFLIFSFVGTVSLAKELELQNSTLSKTIVFEVFPNFGHTKHSSHIVKTYLDLCETKGREPTFVSFEGYVVGRTAVSMLQKMYGDLTRKNFLDSIFLVNHVYSVDDLKIGPFHELEYEGQKDPCNQGLRYIYPVRLINSSSFESLAYAEFTWDGCLSEVIQSKPVLFLKQSAPFTGVDKNLGEEYNSGLKTALFGWNFVRSLNERILYIEPRDDRYNVTKVIANTKDFLSDEAHKTFSLIGYMGTPSFMSIREIINNTRIPVFGFFTGSDALRENTFDNVINVRVGYFEELATLVQLSLDKKLTKFSIFYQIGIGERLEATLSELLDYFGLTLISDANYPHEEVDWHDFTEQIKELFFDGTDFDEKSEMDVEVVILVGTYKPLSQFIDQVTDYQNQGKMKINKKILYACISIVAPLLLDQELKGMGTKIGVNEIVISEVVPFFNDTSKKIVQNFRSEMELLGVEAFFGFVSMEGYLVGELICKVLETFTQEEINVIEPHQVLDRLYELRTIQIDEITLGPYDNGKNDSSKFCNTGMRNAYWVQYDPESPEGIFQVSGHVMTFPSCPGPLSRQEGDLSFFVKPVFFGMSLDLSDERYLDFSIGMENGFQEYVGKIPHINNFLLVKDDQGDLETRNKNIEWIKSKNFFSYIGFETPLPNPGETTMISPLLSSFGGDPNDPNVFYFRPFLVDEVVYVYEFYHNELKKEVAVLLQDSGDFHAKEVLEEFLIPILYSETSEGLCSLLEENKDDYDVIIYLVGDIETYRDTLLPFLRSKNLQEDYIWVFVSQFDSKELAEFHDIEYAQISFLSKTSTFFETFVEEYGTKLEYKDYAFFGYIVAKWIAENSITAESNKRDFFSNALDITSINLENEVVVNFDKECRIGIRKVYLYDKRQKLLMSQEFAKRAKDEEKEGRSNSKVECSLYDAYSPINSDEPNYLDVILVTTLIPSFVLIGGTIWNVVILFIIFMILCCCLLCVCACYFLCCVAFFWCCCVCIVFINQKKKLDAFGDLEIDDVYVLLEEKKMGTKKKGSNLKLSDGTIQIPYKDLKLVEVIGTGGSDSVVYKAKWKTSIGKFVAFKSFRSMSLSGVVDLEAFEKEAAVMSSVSHPNIVQFFGVSIHPKGTRMGFVMEFCANGDISNYMRTRLLHEEEIPYATKLRWMLEICSAMEYLHSMKIIHRDLKLNNVILNKTLTCKLMDFGISRFLETTGSKKTHKMGTSIYMAPEVLSGQYSEKCDIFSFAILSFILVSEKMMPYDDFGAEQIEFRVAASPYFRPQFNEKFNEELEWLKNLLVCLWEDNPNKRKSFHEVGRILNQKYEKLVEGLVKTNLPANIIVESEVTRRSRERSGRARMSISGTVVFIKKRSEDQRTAERFLLIDKTMMGLRDLVKEKWSEEVLIGIFLSSDELKTDEQVEALEGDALIQVVFEGDSYRRPDKRVSMTQVTMENIQEGETPRGEGVKEVDWI